MELLWPRGKFLERGLESDKFLVLLKFYFTVEEKIIKKKKKNTFVEQGVRIVATRFGLAFHPPNMAMPGGTLAFLSMFVFPCRLVILCGPFLMPGPPTQAKPPRSTPGLPFSSWPTSLLSQFYN